MSTTSTFDFDLTQLDDRELLQLLESDKELPPELRALIEEYRDVVSSTATLIENDALPPPVMEESGKKLTVAEQSGSSTTNDLPYAVGDKCAIPFPYESYTVLLPSIILGYWNSTSDDNNASEQYAQVLILIPITTETAPCPVHFENGKGCNRQENCPYSHHGYSVPTEFLLPFEILEQESMLEQLQYGRKVWCKEKNDRNLVWQLGKIIDQTYGPRWRVRLLNVQDRNVKKTIISADIEHIMPFKTLDGSGENVILEEGEEAEWSESEYTASSAMEDNDSIDAGEELENDNEGVRTAAVSDEFGSWQVHTTGFAAKMMKKMGYVTGRGLGALGDGRVEPIQAKPYGKIRFLKGGDQSRPGLGMAIGKKENKQNKVKQQPQKREDKITEENDMFSFMNSLLKDEAAETMKPQENRAEGRKANGPQNMNEAYRLLAKINSNLDKAQYRYVHANEAYRRNKSTPFEAQFHDKLKTALQAVKDLQKQKAEVERHVKTTKAKKEMYTF